MLIVKLNFGVAKTDRRKLNFVDGSVERETRGGRKVCCDFGGWAENQSFHKGSLSNETLRLWWLRVLVKLK